MDEINAAALASHTRLLRPGVAWRIAGHKGEGQQPQTEGGLSA
jgi:hypothetical protein